MTSTTPENKGVVCAAVNIRTEGPWPGRFVCSVTWFHAENDGHWYRAYKSEPGINQYSRLPMLDTVQPDKVAKFIRQMMERQPETIALVLENQHWEDELEAQPTDPRMYTADGTEITDGATLYNYYDCEWVKIVFGSQDSLHHPSHEHWDGWFNTTDLDGNRGPILNGERLSIGPPERS
jgi:hypothetical protein